MTFLVPHVDGCEELHFFYFKNLDFHQFRFFMCETPMLSFFVCAELSLTETQYTGGNCCCIKIKWVNNDVKASKQNTCLGTHIVPTVQQLLQRYNSQTCTNYLFLELGLAHHAFILRRNNRPI